MIRRPPISPLLPYTTLFRSLPRCFAVLGNHDHASTRDPFSRASRLVDLSPATLLRDSSETIELRGARVQVAGVRSEEHTSELQSRQYLACRLLLEKKNSRLT